MKKNNKNYLSLICVGIFVICLSIFSLLSVDKFEVYAADPDGSINDPHTIYSVAEFLEFQSSVNSGTSYEGEFIKLMADLDFVGQTLTPIGNQINKFKGTFDGNGYIIENASISISGEDDILNIGLFGCVENATITNLGVKVESMDASNLVIGSQNIANIGGIAGYTYNSSIYNCFVSNQVAGSNGISVSSYVSANIGGVVGFVSGGQIYNSYSDVKISATQKSSSEVIFNIGGVAGENDSARIYKTFSKCSISDISMDTPNLSASFNIGGLMGFVSGYYSKMYNCFFVGNITLPSSNSTNLVGGLIGSVGAVLPNAGNINFCHFLKNGTFNTSLNTFGNKNGYNDYELLLNGQSSDLVFKSTENLSSATYWNTTDIFDFINVWLIESSYPSLQQFTYYEIILNDVDNCTLSFNDIEGSSATFKVGDSVVIDVTIDEGLEEFYTIKNWKRNSEVIASTGEPLSFVCSYSTSGSYSVVLQPVNFILNITIDAESIGMGGFKYNNSATITTAETTKTVAYGNQVRLTAVANLDYAFMAWEQSGIEVANSTNSFIFIVGETGSLDDKVYVAFEENIIDITLKFTRDVSYFSLVIDGEGMGLVKILDEDNEFSETTVEERLGIDTTITLVAEAKEGYEFLGWFESEGSEEALSTELTFEDYEITQAEQSVYARFSLIDDGSGDYNYTWVIIVSIFGGLGSIGGSVGIVIKKKKSSYKSGFNF